MARQKINKQRRFMAINLDMWENFCKTARKVGVDPSVLLSVLIVIDYPPNMDYIEHDKNKVILHKTVRVPPITPKRAKKYNLTPPQYMRAMIAAALDRLVK